MQCRIRTDLMVAAVVEQLGVRPQVLIMDPEWHLQTERPMVAFFTTEADTLAACEMIADVLRSVGWEQWGHGAGKELVFEGFEGCGGSVLWGKLPWHMHELS